MAAGTGHVRLKTDEDSHGAGQFKQSSVSRYGVRAERGHDALKGCHSMTEIAGTLMNMYMPGLQAGRHVCRKMSRCYGMHCCASAWSGRHAVSSARGWQQWKDGSSECSSAWAGVGRRRPVGKVAGATHAQDHHAAAAALAAGQQLYVQQVALQQKRTG